MNVRACVARYPFGTCMRYPHVRAIFLPAILFFCMVYTHASEIDSALSSLPKDSSFKQLDKITIRGRRIQTDRAISVTEKEQIRGLQEDVNAILADEPGVQKVHEAGSSLLIRGEGRYDYEYRIWNIPVLTASHFTNHAFADRSALMIASVDDLSLTGGALAGRYADVSAGVVSVNPGFARLSNPRWKKRPELVINVGSLGMDFSLSTPLRDNKDMYQLSWRFVDESFIKWLNFQAYESSRHASATAPPGSYQDLIVTGQTRLGRARAHEYAWIAYDQYGSDTEGRHREPWGFGAVTFTDSGRPYTRSITAGGSHQYISESKRYGIVIPYKKVYQTNAVLDASLDDISFMRWRLDCGAFCEYRNWRGAVTSVWDSDSLALSDAPSRYAQSGEDMSLYGRAGLKGAGGRFDYGVNALAGMYLPALKTYVNPGLWTQLSLPNGWVGLSAGVHTSRPDIRGLPDSAYRERLLTTAQLSLRAGTGWRMVGPLAAVLEAEGYVKYRNRSPAFADNPALPIWDREKETSLGIGGLSGAFKLEIAEIIAGSFVANFVRSRRIHDTTTSAYEWEIPWSTTGTLRFLFFDKTLNLYLSGSVAPGLPYRDLVCVGQTPWFSGTMSRAPLYKRIDCKLQLNQPIEKHRYLTRFSLCAEMTNVINFLQYHFSDYRGEWANVREYYWDAYYNRRPVDLDPCRLTFTVRMGFRL